MFSKPKSEYKTYPPQNTISEPVQRRSLLHYGIVIQGDWESDGIVEFGGAIIGDLTVDVLILKGTGTIEGNVRARSVTVEGQLNGTIAAIDVVLASTATFKGEIVAESIRIDFGAIVEGDLHTVGKKQG